MTIENNAPATDSNINAIDAALAKAKAAKPGRVAKPKATEAPADGTPATEAPKAKRPVKTDEEKAAALLAIEQARAVKKVEKADKKAAKLAAYEASKAEKKAARLAKKAEKAATVSRTPHFAKVEKAASKLPAVNENEAKLAAKISALGAEAASRILAHIEHTLRAVQTKASLERKLEVGQTVTISAGPAAYLGLTGTVVKVQRIRALVEVPGHNKPIYVFTADVTPVSGEVSTEAPASEPLANVG